MTDWINASAWHGVLFVAAVITVICAAIGLAWWLSMQGRAPEAQALEADLDALDTPLPPLPASDLVGGDEDAGTGLAEGPPPVSAGGAVPDTGAALFYGRTADRLTGKQRRRAIRNGRLPRPIPGDVLALLADDAPGEITGPFSITDLGGGVAPAPAAAEHHLPGPDSNQGAARTMGQSGELLRAGESRERTPQPLMLTVYDPWFRQARPVFPTLLQSAAWEADLRVWESELGPLVREAEAWSRQLGRELAAA